MCVIDRLYLCPQIKGRGTPAEVCRTDKAVVKPRTPEVRGLRA